MFFSVIGTFGPVGYETQFIHNVCVKSNKNTFHMPFMHGNLFYAWY